MHGAGLLDPVGGSADDARSDEAASERLARALSGMEQALEAHDEGLVIVDEEGHVEFATGTARRILAAWFGSVNEAALRRLLDRSDERAASAPPVALERGNRRLMVRVIRGIDDRHDVVVLREHSAHPDLSAFTHLGLTRREAEVLALVAEGRTNADAAEQLGVAPTTVKKHLENVFDKLGVDNRAAAASKAVQITAGLGR